MNFLFCNRSSPYQRSLFFGMITTQILTACTMIPHYHRPKPPLAKAWPTYAKTDNISTNIIASNIGWKNFFIDPRLRALIAIAIRENRDLRAAAASIVEAQGEYDVQHAELFPSISETSRVMYMMPSRAAGLSFAPGLDMRQNPTAFHFYQGGIGFSSYEIDLFGRIRSLTRQAKENALSRVSNVRSLLISVISQVAIAYITWLGDQNLLNITTQTLANQQENLHLIQNKFHNGEANMLTVRQAETQVAQSATLLSEAKRKVEQDKNLLTLLIGAPIPSHLPPPNPLGKQTILADIPAGLPSDLLENRPDIISAEHALLAAQANIGAARAAFFPRITLTATNGLTSLAFHKLFTTAATTWGFNPSLEIPIWTWGQNRGNLIASKAQRDSKIASYEKTVQAAFREVADALAARKAYLNEKRQVDAWTNSAAKAYHLTKLRFDVGTDSYLNTLEAQRSYLQAQQIQTRVAVAKYQNLVTIYRSLGGGWKEHTDTKKLDHPTTKEKRLQNFPQKPT